MGFAQQVADSFPGNGFRICQKRFLDSYGGKRFSCGLSSFILARMGFPEEEFKDYHFNCFRDNIHIIMEKLFVNVEARNGFIQGWDGNREYLRLRNRAYQVWHRIGQEAYELAYKQQMQRDAENGN